MLSTKPQTNNFTLFKPTPDGHASYDPEYCIIKPSGVEYGYSDGLLPSIEHVWGQSEFGYDPELLKGNTGFVDLRSEIDDSALMSSCTYSGYSAYFFWSGIYTASFSVS